MTTIKIYGKIRSNNFSGNYTPCAIRAKQVFTYGTCLEGSLNVDNFDKSLLLSLSFTMESSLLSNRS